MSWDWNLAAVITTRILGVLAMIGAFAIPCIGFPFVAFPGPWWKHIDLTVIALVATPFVLVPVSLVLLHVPRRRRPSRDQVCRVCGYDVRSQGPEGTCPECGTPI